ncbi:uncharacterized protein LOC112051334 [Bicyclus anynana]|uniref:Uncharacterized protein LOC112051334 n=1 Tax=Bicyclus anynana TaxID=110368 RepID=A0ABM3LFI7_BICAN|nr:uncharacterized protein LOC112051334 [Bicyclus anynana]
MAHTLSGKVALVTGGASGIGAATVKCLLEEGVKHVAVLDVAEEAGIALQNELNTKYGETKVTFIKGDVTDKETLIGTFKTVQDRIGYIDVVVNNAGILDDTLENFERSININLTSLIRSSLYSWKIMHKERGGSGGTIINYSSIASLAKYNNIPVYSATKSAVLTFSTCLGDDKHYSSSGVRVLTVCFGATDTPIVGDFNRAFDESALLNFDEMYLQSTESAAKAVIEAYKQGASGSVWFSYEDNPARDITEEHNKSMESYIDCIKTTKIILFQILLVRYCFRMAYSLNEKIVMLTGAASGIGASVVKYLLNENVKHVAILDVSEEAGIALKNELNSQYNDNKVTFIKCDVADKENLLQAYKVINDEIGYIDLVINNAGILDDSPDSYVMEININLISVITSSLHAWKAMHTNKGGKGGTIINVSSVVALTYAANVPIYCTTKIGVLKFSTSLGNIMHYSRSGVRVLCICFGLTDTPLLTNLHGQLFDKDAEDSVTGDLIKHKSQSVESAAKAVIETYKQGASGSVWISTSDKAAMDVTNTYDKSVQMFDDYVYN